jgi:WD40 repeat protein
MFLAHVLQVAVWDLAHTSRRSSASGASGAPAAAGGAPVLTLLQHHKEPVIGVAWSHDGNTLASADKAGGLAMWCCLT